MDNLTLTPIGIVHNAFDENGPSPRRSGLRPRVGGHTVIWEDVVSEIVLDKRYTEALDGIEEFSHIIVVFWLDRAEKPKELKNRPMRREDMPLVGLFATRTPNRPNPIGVTLVQLLERRDNVLRVKGLDVFNGTPVLDIKPYIPYNVPVQGDRTEDARVPEWVRRFNEEREKRTAS